MPNEHESSLIERAMQHVPLQLPALSDVNSHSLPPLQSNEAPSEQRSVTVETPKRRYSGNSYEGEFFERAKKPMNAFTAFMVGEAEWRPGYWLRTFIERLKK